MYSKKKFTKSYLTDPISPVIERKNIDSLDLTYNCPLTSSFGSPVFLTPIAQGTDQQERIGRSIRIKSVQIRLKTVTTGSPAVGQIRYVIVYDRQSNGVTPVSTDVFAGSAQFNDPMQLNYKERFVVLMDRITDSQQSSAVPISDKAYVKCDLDQIWAGAGGSAGNIRTGSIWLFMANNADSAVGVASDVNYSVRVRFTDA